MKDFLSIKEFSQLSGIEQTTLRYWDDIGLFSPARRDPENNYRYYTPEQIIAVNFITVLSELNIPLKTIGEIEKNRTPDKILSLIEHQEELLDMEMRSIRERSSIIHQRHELISMGMRLKNGFRIVDGVRIDTDRDAGEGSWLDKNEIAVLQRTEKKFLLGPRNEWTPGEPFFKYFVDFCKMADDLRINLNYPVGGYHVDFESFEKAPGEPDHFFSLDPTGNKKWKEGKYLTGFCEGYYGRLGDLAERMRVYIKENKLRVEGPVYTLYLLDEVCMTDPDEYLSLICVAVS